MHSFTHTEKHLSQIPALQVLINAGYTYLSPQQALEHRNNKLSNVLLSDILISQLKKINRINYKNTEYLFSEENIQSAIQKLKNIRFDGVHQTAEAAYDLLTLGTTLEQMIEGDTKSFSFKYIDWENWEHNTFHVTAEFSVERTGSYETCRPDIVLFVNGIPLAVLECKSPKEDVEQAISQNIRNQKQEYIPQLFHTAQLLIATNKNKTLYATTGTPAKFWSVWQELGDKTEDSPDYLQALVHKSLPDPVKETLFTGDFETARRYFDSLEAQPREVTVQDISIYNLLRPQRLLDLIYRFIVFDNGIKKIARYQQYFVVHSALDRIRQQDSTGKRSGGIVWHTQGSGKSLTMVMLARAIALSKITANPRIILVTDRVDLDRQLTNTFKACGLDPDTASTGRELLDLIAEKRSTIITTLVHKFDKALNARNFKDEANDIFLLVDESHRTNFGTLAAQMRKMLPNACYIGFTGTPILKKEKNNIVTFGGLIEPHYSIQQAVKDGAVVPLLYEGRHVEMEQNKIAMDGWFDRTTSVLNDAQRADLKRKYARAEMLNKADQVIHMRAWDISEHFEQHWQNTGFKAQLVAPNKVSAIRYHQYLEEIGKVSSAVIISAPDMREGNEEVEEEVNDEVQQFWKKMMTRFGSETNYNELLISQFKNGEDPEILIVVDKLLTGFDAPRNAVLYLCRKLKEHTLLQAVARVNRIYEGKDFGYIVDYAAILGDLDQALTMYAEAGLDQYDETDIAQTLMSIQTEVDKLPALHGKLWDIFKAIQNKQDEEAFELLLADEAKRDSFYDALNAFAKCLGVALSSATFLDNTPEYLLMRYKSDLRRFVNLRTSVKLRYAETVDYRRDFEPKIKKLLDTHIQANSVTQLNEPVDIFDEEVFKQLQKDQGVLGGKTISAKADTIAHATKKAIYERLDEDPAFYQTFSALIQQAIDDFRQQRITDMEYLNRVQEIRYKITHKVREGIPQQIAGNDDAIAFYGMLKPYLKELGDEKLVSTVTAIIDIIRNHMKVNYWLDENAQKDTINSIDDYLFDVVKGEYGLDLDTDTLDVIIEQVMNLAKHRITYGN